MGVVEAAQVDRGEAAGSTIRLGTLKKGWRLLGMRVTTDAALTFVTGVLQLGVSGTPSKYTATNGVACDAVVSVDANHTDALDYGKVLAADTELIVTTLNAILRVGTKLMVAVRYVRDE